VDAGCLFFFCHCQDCFFAAKLQLAEIFFQTFWIIQKKFLLLRRFTELFNSAARQQTLFAEKSIIYSLLTII
jgi:hypothetical protein